MSKTFIVYNVKRLQFTESDLCSGLCWRIALSFRFLTFESSSGVERLTGLQGGERQIQLLTQGGKHDIVVERDFLKQLHL